MHTYTLRVGMVGLNDKKSVAHVKKVFHEALQEDFDNSGKILKQRMAVKLEKILGSSDSFFIWVDEMWKYSTPEKKSFFLNIMVRNLIIILVWPAR